MQNLNCVLYQCRLTVQLNMDILLFWEHFFKEQLSFAAILNQLQKCLKSKHLVYSMMWVQDSWPQQYNESCETFTHWKSYCSLVIWNASLVQRIYEKTNYMLNIWLSCTVSREFLCLCSVISAFCSVLQRRQFSFSWTFRCFRCFWMKEPTNLMKLIGYCSLMHCLLTLFYFLLSVILSHSPHSQFCTCCQTRLLTRLFIFFAAC